MEKAIIDNLNNERVATMEKEFNLSERSKGLEDGETMLMPNERLYLEEDVKEFIRRLKDGNDMYEIETDEGICGVIDIKKLYDKIDKLSGGL